MDPNSFDPEDDSAAMAAAMGFSSFGGQDRPAKKRRYNAGSDAIVASSLPSALPGSLPPKPSAPARLTGANQLPLHQRTPRGPGSSAAAGKNADEIDLDDDEVDGDQGGAPVATHGGLGGSEHADEDPPPQYLDTSRLPTSYEEPMDGGAGAWHGHRGGRAGAQRGGSRGGRGGYGGSGLPQWWLDYYDPSSNQNPWERLERARGIDSKGTWLARSTKEGRDSAAASAA
ncbi:hypothetical protein GQ53DRAFT_830352 [Thozetella sp. PMI_491]|nr:hypothetical protein GQ53DRAFT_830352 [Thozetella sp. PMI_491]